LDIRALARRHVEGARSRAEVGAAMGQLGAARGPAIGQPGAIRGPAMGHGTLHAPILEPVRREESRGLVVAAVVTTVIAIGLAVGLAVVLLTRPAPAAPVPLAPGPPPAQMAEIPPAPEIDDGVPGSAVESDEEPAVAPDPAETATAIERRPPVGRRPRRDRRPAAAPAAAPVARGVPPHLRDRSDRDPEVESILAGVLGAPGPAPTQTSRPSLPETPPRDDVVRALRSVAGRVSACGGGARGVATTTLTLDGATGRVTAARVTGPFAGTAVGSCVARAVRGARFPRFRRASFAVTFPYRL
jgi:hypothetical protein